MCKGISEGDKGEIKESPNLAQELIDILETEDIQKFGEYSAIFDGGLDYFEGTIDNLKVINKQQY